MTSIGNVEKLTKELGKERQKKKKKKPDKVDEFFKLRFKKSFQFSRQNLLAHKLCILSTIAGQVSRSVG